ncbi:MAG: alpha/beta hydrolase [Alphaproteobacteria bacterium]|nr:alpha/beta hydrolase [Alphaproteobacteria bacterium]
MRVYKILAVGFITYGALVGALSVFQRHLMYFPATDKPSPADFGVPEMDEVSLKTKDGLDLLAWYRAPQSDALPVILYFHGNAGHIGYRAGKVRPYIDAGFGVLLVSYRGYAGNPGRPTEEGLYQDGRAAVAFVAGKGIPARRTVFYGESLGSGVAVQLATEGTPGAVVLEAPFTSTADIAAKHYPFVPVRYLVWDRFDSMDKIAGVQAPLLFLHGERDRIVPVRYGRKLFEAASEPKSARYFAEAGHNDLYTHGAAGEVIDFLRKTFKD